MLDFKVYKSQIPEIIIDDFLLEHGKFKDSPLSVFRAQGTTDFEKPILDQYNNQKNSIQNPHLLGLNKNFRNLILKILHSEIIYKCLVDFLDCKDLVHYQSMFFDKSTATQLHQDSWYLDTMPKKNLVGVWIALEDISSDSGQFCLYTKSDTKLLSSDSYNFLDLDNDKLFKDHYPNSKKYIFNAKKGDILIWNSFVIHGALNPKSDKSTRKSLTAHYYPKNLKIQDQPIKRFFNIYDHTNPLKTQHPNIFQATVINPFIYNSLCYFLYNLKGFKHFISGDVNTDKKLSEIRVLK